MRRRRHAAPLASGCILAILCLASLNTQLLAAANVKPQFGHLSRSARPTDALSAARQALGRRLPKSATVAARGGLLLLTLALLEHWRRRQSRTGTLHVVTPAAKAFAGTPTRLPKAGPDPDARDDIFAQLAEQRDVAAAAPVLESDELGGNRPMLDPAKSLSGLVSFALLKTQTGLRRLRGQKHRPPSRADAAAAIPAQVAQQYPQQPGEAFIDASDLHVTGLCQGTFVITNLRLLVLQEQTVYSWLPPLRIRQKIRLQCPISQIERCTYERHTQVRWLLIALATLPWFPWGSVIAVAAIIAYTALRRKELVIIAQGRRRSYPLDPRKLPHSRATLNGLIAQVKRAEQAREAP